MTEIQTQELGFDTIVALATPEGTAGLAVVRISGPGSIEVVRKLLPPEALGSEISSHNTVYSILKNPITNSSGSYESIDQVLVLPMLAPRSYTGEDTVEIFCHGGRVVSRQVVEACVQAGARPASAGEFTRRAFLNGKLTLDQAEAVADLIHAESRHSARAAVRQLLGGLDDELSQIEAPLLGLLAKIEGSLEFLEEEDVGVTEAEIFQVLEGAAGRIDRLLELAPAGRLLRDGVQVVLTGPVNVGKSSLFNALLEEDRAIVDDEAGTTRDVVTSALERDGIRFHFHDTAGLRNEAGRVENKGIVRTREMAGQADIVLALFEPGRQPETDDLADPRSVVVPVMTKADLAGGDPAGKQPEGCVVTSSKDGSGLDDLWAALKDAVSAFQIDQAVTMGVLLNARHRHKLSRCRSDLQLLLEESAGHDLSLEVAGTMLSSILSNFGEISGRVFSEQLLESIFQRFCVGK